MRHSLIMSQQTTKTQFFRILDDLLRFIAAFPGTNIGNFGKYGTLVDDGQDIRVQQDWVTSTGLRSPYSPLKGLKGRDFYGPIKYLLKAGWIKKDDSGEYSPTDRGIEKAAKISKKLPFFRAYQKGYGWKTDGRGKYYPSEVHVHYAIEWILPEDKPKAGRDSNGLRYQYFAAKTGAAFENPNHDP